MLTNNLTFSLFKEMLKDNLNYVYRGNFSQNITDNILSFTEVNLSKVGESNKIKKRIFTIMVEGLQNITRHQEISASQSTNEEGIFLMQNIDNHYYITTGNPIFKENIPKLTQQINKINGLDSVALKQYYKEVLNDNIISKKGGAGLGLIEIARKSDNKLIYDFVDLNEHYSYFYLTTTISQQNIAQGTQKRINFLEGIKEIHSVLNKENIVLIFNGVFNQESLLNLLSIIQHHMKDDFVLKKKLFNIMVEMLQNIVKHGAVNDEETEKTGIFHIGKKEDVYYLNTGNYVKKSETKNLIEKMNYVNTLSLEQLDEFYEKNLFHFPSDSSEKSGLGFVEIRLKTRENLAFKITEYNDDLSFFELQTLIK